MNLVCKMMAATAVLASAALAHDGRRFEIKVVDGKLVAHGYISDGVNDGGGVVRPYYNAIHGHWANLGGAATADLPGFDLFGGGELTGHSLTLEVVGARKWVSPPMMLNWTVVPMLVPMDAGETIFVSLGFESVSTDAPGVLTLSAGVPAGGLSDVDLSYDYPTGEPAGVIYALEVRLGTDAPGVSGSDAVFVLLSPDGATPMERLHHASLHLEKYLGTAVCVADLTGAGDPSDGSYGVADGDADGDDFFFYLDAFTAGGLLVCDLTGSSDPNDAGFGVRDGDCDGEDFFFFLDAFVAGCE